VQLDPSLQSAKLFERGTRGCLIGLCLSLLTARASLAQAADDTGGPTAKTEAAPPARRAAAEERFHRGLDLAGQQRWDAALAEFLASRELFPTRSATRNAAIALGRLARYAESLAHYEALLEEFGPTMPPDHLQAVRRELEAVKAQTAEVFVDVSEPGVSVVLDGEPRGSTPLKKALRVNPGTHVLRFAKAGFESTAYTLSVAAGTSKAVTSRLRPLSELGTLVVREAEDRALGVLIDGALVGTTPWSGLVARGVHSVQLRSDSGLGTAPGAVTVRAGATNALVVRASLLDAGLRIEPSPSTAALFLDGTALGSGVWEGRIPSGAHRVEATAPGHWLFRRQVRLSPGEELAVRASLERDGSSPLWRRSADSRFYAELSVSGLFSPSLRSASGACDCREGGAAGASGTALLGYVLGKHLGLEASAGAMTVHERVGRKLLVPNDSGTLRWRSTDFEERVRLTGPFFGIGAALRFVQRFPLTGRIGAGIAVLHTDASSSGTLTSEPVVMTRGVTLEEQSAWLVTPFISSELRLGYAVSKRVSIDVGLGLRLFVPARKPRRDTSPAFGEPDERAVALRDEPGDATKAGVVTLPGERIAGAFLAVTPALALRLGF
jgi:PEGA domain